MKYLLLPLLLLSGAAFAEEPAHSFELNGLEILHPWTRESDEDHALVFMELHNEGSEAITILGARTEAGAKGHLVGFHLDHGHAHYEELPAIPVAPEAHLDMAPDGLALELDGIAQPREHGGHFDMILITSAGEIAIEVVVEEADAHQHSHAGHSH